MINVDRRDWLIEIRRKLGISREGMAKACKCSPYLIEIIEDGGAITHPHIAARIARRYGLPVERYNELVHPDHAARVVPKWREPPSAQEFTWSAYASTIEKEVEFA